MRISSTPAGRLAALLTAGIVTAMAPAPASASPGAASAPGPAARPFPSAGLWSASFTSPRHGYGYFIQAAGTRCHGIVARTIDGGARFTRPVVVRAWPCAGGVPWQVHIAASDRGDVFLYGPGLYASHDGGATWSRIPMPGTVLGVSAVGRSVWLLRQVCVPRALAFCHLRVLISADGGRRWRQPAAQPWRPGRYEQSGAELVRTGPSSGYVVLPPGFDVARGHGAGTAPLLATSDGGKSWARRRVPCARSMTAVLLAAVPGGRSRLAAVCAGQPAMFRQAKMIAVSGDAGRTWTVHRPCPLNPNKGLRCLLDLGYASQIASPRPGTIFLAGVHVSLDASRDGGRAWHLVEPPPEGTFTDPEELELGFLSRSAGFLLGLDQRHNRGIALWRTADGGRTWHEVIPALG